MYAYVRTASVEPSFGSWSVVVVLSDDGNESGQQLEFDHEPDDTEIVAAATSVTDMLNAAAADRELRDMLQGGPFTLNYQDAPALAVRFRAAYRPTSGSDTARLAFWIVERLANAELTDAQVSAAFEMGTDDYTALLGRLQTLHDMWLAIQYAAGE
jgi:hypothetical protein